MATILFIQIYKIYCFINCNVGPFMLRLFGYVFLPKLGNLGAVIGGGGGGEGAELFQ